MPLIQRGLGLCTLLLGLFTSGLLAAEPLLIAKGDEDYRPYEFTNSEGQVRGFHIDLIHLAAQKAGFNSHFQTVPWTRALEITKRGDTQAISYASYNAERAKELIYLRGNLISVADQHLITRRDLHPPLQKIGNNKRLQTLSLGLVRGYSYGDKLEQLPHTKRHYVPTEKQLLPFLLAGRVDAIVLNNNRLQRLLERQPNSALLQVIEPPFTSADIYLAFSRRSSNQEQACRFAQALAEVKRSNAVGQLQARYNISPQLPNNWHSAAPCAAVIANNSDH